MRNLVAVFFAVMMVVVVTNKATAHDNHTTNGGTGMELRGGISFHGEEHTLPVVGLGAVFPLLEDTPLLIFGSMTEFRWAGENVQIWSVRPFVGIDTMGVDGKTTPQWVDVGVLFGLTLGGLTEKKGDNFKLVEFGGISVEFRLRLWNTVGCSLEAALVDTTTNGDGAMGWTAFHLFYQL